MSSLPTPRTGAAVSRPCKIDSGDILLSACVADLSIEKADLEIAERFEIMDKMIDLNILHVVGIMAFLMFLAWMKWT